MAELRFINKISLAAMAGVSPATISGKFPKSHPGVISGKIDLQHPEVQAYLSYRESYDIQPQVSSKRVIPAGKAQFSAPAIPEDIPKPKLPEELASLTLQEIVDLYGHLPGFKSYVSVLAELENLKIKTTKNQHSRGLLIDKAQEGKTLLEILGMLFKRLVDEIPKTGIKRIIGIVKRNEDDAEIAAIKAFQEINGKALEICKNEILTRLETTEQELLGEKSVK